MRSKMAAQRLLSTEFLTFRVLRKLDSGRTDRVVFEGTGQQNVRVAGHIDDLSTGYCHVEFSVNASDCVVTTLTTSVVNPSNGCGFLSFSFVNDTGRLVENTVIITDFVQESDGGKYNFYVNGWCGRTKLPPLV